ncbi:alpha-galactosidase [Auriculariales sp. MPI-PUGE-AT-0066]|nr:alpha-galactosidase [Auriculariales sp. MPI-PUGE-AT-0066]
MGWNHWNTFGCDPTEDIILQTAQALVDTGLNIVVDDCWHAESRDLDTGAPKEDLTKFPHGLKWLSDQLHTMGLKFGIYSSAGTFTCGGHFGSLGYEEIDAKTYAEWGVDYLKYDNCNNEGQSGTPKLSYDRFNKMREALKATGRPILYALCNWGEDQPWNWAGTIAHSWRISGDIHDASHEFSGFDPRCPCTSMLDCKLPGWHCSVTRIIDFAALLVAKIGSGRWNDMDMLEVGRGGMNQEEYSKSGAVVVTHFSMWAFLKSPLILGHDIRNTDNTTLEIITNEEIIAINQDTRAAQPVRKINRLLKSSAGEEDGTLSVWTVSLSTYPTNAIAVLNTGSETQSLTLEFAEIWSDAANLQNLTYDFVDLWQKNGSGKWGQSVGKFSQSFEVSVEPHQTKVFKVIAQS